MVSAPAAGDPAPDFTLPSTAGPVSLADLCARGKLVLAFYQEDGTPTCSRELNAFKEEYPLFCEAGAEILAVSADSLASHERFAERAGGFPFPLASDPDLAMAAQYGAVDESGKRCARAVYVIDQDRRVLLHIPHYAVGNVEQYTEIFAALGAL
jgi:peroxiredoxin Q/BCP